MNCTNQNTETQISPLKARCNRMGIHVPCDNPTPAEIVPIIEQRLAAHQKHRSKNANPWTGDFAEWKNIHDAYTEFLSDLQEVGRRCPQRAASAHNTFEKPIACCVQPASEKQTTTTNPITLTSSIPPVSPILLTPQNKIPPSEPGKNSEPPQPQQTHARNEPGTKSEQPGIKSESPGITQNDPGKFPNKTGNSRQPKPISEPSSSTTPSSENAAPSGQEDPDAPPKIQSTDEEFIAAVADLHYQRKGRSPFDKLSDQDQAIVIDLCEKFTWQTVLKTSAQPSPIGYALKAGKTALYDFRKRYEKRCKEQKAQANIDLLNKSSDPAHTFAEIFARLIQTKVLAVASDPHLSLNTCDALITTLNKFRKQTLAERKQLHAETSK
jgi:hypothetical protein